MEHHYVVHYAEIALKGQNRSLFEKQLVENIALKHGVVKAWRLPGRIILRAGPELDLSMVFGVAWWAQAECVNAEVGEIGVRAIKEAVQRLAETRTFAIRAKVAEKRFGMNSQELEVEIGQQVRDATDLEVNLTTPDLTIFIEITQTGALVFTKKQAGPGGLPVGTSAKMMGLFSGGMDSGLATYLMAKRGSRIELMHFHALPNAEAAHGGKIGEMARKLREVDSELCVHYVPYHRFELATSGLHKKLQRHELVVFRRFIARAAERLASERRAKALFTGDNLGQVASQTMENLVAVNDAIRMPMFRPLIAYDKVEIVHKTRAIGIYDIAIKDYKDCCSLIAKHPATRANRRMISVIEAEIGVDELLEEVLCEVTTVEF